MTSAAFDQDAFRARQDDVALNSTTFNGGGGLNGNWKQRLGVNFRVRFVIQETNGKASQNLIAALYYQKNGTGGYVPVTTASSNIILTNDTQSIADHAATTQVIGAGTYSVGESLGFDDGTTDNFTSNLDFSGSDEVEVEFCCQLVPADMSPGDYLELRVYQSDGTQLDVYTNWPTVRVPERAHVARAA